MILTSTTSCESLVHHCYTAHVTTNSEVHCAHEYCHKIAKNSNANVAYYPNSEWA